jgi:ATP-dependent helicase/nuclease subunit A
MSLTGSQKDAIAARGNVLVVAGAGTGKTTTMVERCLDCLVRQSSPVALDEILMVTFTEAAATEMRQRIRARLIQESEQNPNQTHWLEQLALFETAYIGTLHSFCFQLIRQHFYELELDPQVTVLPEEEARLQADDVLDELLQRHYASRGDTAAAVQQLIQSQGRGWDEPIRRLVLRLHHYTQTLPNPSDWIQNQLTMFGEPKPVAWKRWRLEAIAEWCWDRLPVTEELTPTNEIATRCAPLLRQLQSAKSEQERAEIFESLLAASECPRGKKELWFKPLEKFFVDARFLASLAPELANDPLQEDWTWVRSDMITVLGLAEEFTRAFTDAKRELGLLDFHDLEQYALRLLWDSRANEPTSIAKTWRQKLRFVFVDEYQDINAAQDKILQALSRDGAAANRFLVGDIKQSIYRFRLADPCIFRGYLEAWGKREGTALPLVENFRSREALVNFINAVFSQIMRPEIGGVAYDEQARLRFGAPGERIPLSVAALAAPCVELHLRTRSNLESADADDQEPGLPSEIVELEEAEKEARLIAFRLLELKSRRHPVWDEILKGFRPIEWRDIALLLRAPANKAEAYAKEFARLNIPLQVARRGFYRSLEISDLVSLLQILDNPLQDLPVLAVLHSPLVGLTLNELAAIRLTLPKGHFWNAVIRWTENERQPAKSPDAEPQPAEHGTRNTPFSDSLSSKLTAFLERYGRWRRLVRQVSLSRCLETILGETHYGEWLLTQSHGEQRHANVQRLVALAERFDQFQRQGLFRFLRFIESQQAAEAEPEVPAVSEEDAVRLMSIHQSKGLEFPVVVLADLGKPFNRSDLSADIIVDEEYGLCPQIKPPHTGQRYPSLPYWLARRRQTQELLGEELRLLYVGMTRAKDTLILSASVSSSRLQKVWCEKRKLSLEVLRGAQSYADWLGFWFAQNSTEDPVTTRQGQTNWLSWFLHDDSRLLDRPAAEIARNDSDLLKPEADPGAWEKLQQRLAWKYPWNATTLQPAKTSVSALRRRAMVAEEDSSPVAWTGASRRRFSSRTSVSKTRQRKAKLSAAEIGDAHHTFLQMVALERTGSIAGLEQEAERLRSEGALTLDETAALDLKGIASFWSSDLGRQIRAQAAFVQRELAFTARFSPGELARLTGDSLGSGLEEEYVVVQGIADLAVVLPGEIWLVDFKTDEMKAGDVERKVKLYQPQLWVYAKALSRTFNRPVSQCWLYFLSLGKSVSLESI